MTAIQKLFYIPLVTIYILTFVITVLMIGLQIHGGFNINETVLSTLIGASLVESVVAFLLAICYIIGFVCMFMFFKPLTNSFLVK